jgi:hypothetical protein
MEPRCQLRRWRRWGSWRRTRDVALLALVPARHGCRTVAAGGNSRRPHPSQPDCVLQAPTSATKSAISRPMGLRSTGSALLVVHPERDAAVVAKPN